MVFHRLSRQSIAEDLIAASDDGKIPIVSVGSGNGECEKELMTIGVKNMILVDPYPLDYRPGDPVVIRPDYPTIQYLIADRPQIVNECVLFIPWSDPCDAIYDLEAINLLNPKSVVIISEKRHFAAGSYILHIWLHHNIIPNWRVANDNDMNEKEVQARYESFKPKSNYLEVDELINSYDGDNGALYNLLWLCREDQNGKFCPKSLDRLIPNWRVRELVYW